MLPALLILSLNSQAPLILDLGYIPHIFVESIFATTETTS